MHDVFVRLPFVIKFNGSLVFSFKRETESYC